MFRSNSDPDYWRCEIYFSPGVTDKATAGDKESPALAPYVQLNKNITFEELCECIDNGIAARRERIPRNNSTNSGATSDDDAAAVIEAQTSECGCGSTGTTPLVNEPFDSTDRWEHDLDRKPSPKVARHHSKRSSKHDSFIWLGNNSYSSYSIVFVADIFTTVVCATIF